MTEIEEKELRDEIFQEEMVRSELRKLSGEDLAHVDNIITSISKLKESRSVDATMWAMLFMWFLGMPMSRFNGVITSNKEEDETDKVKLGNN